MAKGLKFFGYFFWILSSIALLIYVSGELIDVIAISWLQWIKIEDVKMGCLLGVLVSGLLAFIFISLAFKKQKRTIQKYEHRKKVRNEVVQSVGTYVDDKAARRVAKMAAKEKRRREKEARRREKHKKHTREEIYEMLGSEVKAEPVKQPEPVKKPEQKQDELKAMFRK